MMPRSSRSAIDEFVRLKRDGRTIVFVTHDMCSVERFCDRAMLHRQRARWWQLGDPRSSRARTTS